MKIAVTSAIPTIDAPVGTKLLNSKYLLIINPDTMEYKAMLNLILSISGPAMWKLFTQELFQEDVGIILVGDCNSNVSKSLGDAGIQVISGLSGSICSVVEQFKEMCLAETIIEPIKDEDVKE